MAFSDNWISMFTSRGECDVSEASRLGVDYVTASASETTFHGLTIQQDLSHLGIAGVVWNCARVLVEFLKLEPQRIARQHVVELGAGTGAVGLAIALSCCPHRLVLTDLPDVVEQLTQRNVACVAEAHPSLRTMLSQKRLLTTAHRWGTALAREIVGCKVALCSDCLYEPREYGDLLCTLVALEPEVIYLAYKQRHREREREFFEAAGEFFDVLVWGSASSVGEATAFLEETIFICCLRTKSHKEDPNNVDNGSGDER